MNILRVTLDKLNLIMLTSRKSSRRLKNLILKKPKLSKKVKILRRLKIKSVN